MRWILLVTVLTLAACDGDERSRRPGGDGGAGGEVAPGGSGGSGGDGGGTGGSGGEDDVQGPELSIAEPAHGTTLEDPDVTVRGVATDDRGVAALWWEDSTGVRWDLPADGSEEVAFAFDVVLEEGANEFSVQAKDAAGNRTELPLALRYENTPGRRPQIVQFESDRPWAERGEFVTLRWKVTGTRPIELVLYGSARPAQDVSNFSSRRVEVIHPSLEAFGLQARNQAGYATARVDVGTGESLRIWPRQATIVPGSRQQLVVVNAPEAEWSVVGGEIGTTMYPIRTFFRAETPGVYTVTATTHEAEPRTASTTITVAPAASAVAGFRGVGGQFARVNGWSKGAAVDTSGRLWVVLPNRGGLASWDPAEGYWTLVGDEDHLLTLATLSGGELAVGGLETMRRLAPGADAWSVAPLPEMNGHHLQEFGPDGTLYRTRWSYGQQPAGLFALAPGAAAFEELPVPALAEISALAFDEVGGLFLAGKDEAELTSVHRRLPGGEWVDTGPVPFPAEPVRDLIVGADGVVHLAGRTLAALGAAGWTTVGSFPTCDEDELCGLFDLDVRSDGALLAVERSQLYVQVPGGGFEPVGTPHPAMSVPNSILGTLRQVARAPDGTLYLQGDLGVFALPSGSGAWVPLTEPGLPAGAETHDLIVEPDGSWTLASGGWAGQDGLHSFYRRPADGGAWTGFGNRALHIYDADPIFAIDRDGAGNLWALGGYPHQVFGIEAETDAVLDLPFDAAIAQAQLSNPYGLGVTVDGTIYLGGYIANDWRVYRLRPGEERWTTDGSLDCASDFERGPDGALWAVCSNAVFRLSAGRWAHEWDGLPTDGSTTCEDLALAEDGALLLAVNGGGVFRRPPGASSWQRLGFGDPSMSATRVASRGGRTWVLGAGGLHELDPATQTWLPVEGVLPAGGLSVFEADAGGNLLIAEPEGLGLLQSFDGP